MKKPSCTTVALLAALALAKFVCLSPALAADGGDYIWLKLVAQF